jgi:Utp25, U3 small nucleolar RNA-associated SSU processome protein 25
VREVVFYSLPMHAQYYLDVFSMLEADSGGGELHATAQALFCPHDFMALAGIVGHSRAQRMIKDPAPSFLFT